MNAADNNLAISAVHAPGTLRIRIFLFPFLVLKAAGPKRPIQEIAMAISVKESIMRDTIACELLVQAQTQNIDNRINLITETGSTGRL